LFTLPPTRDVFFRRGWGPVTYQLETRTHYHLPIQINIDFRAVTPAIGELMFLD
jgi:hypothetical protein